MAGNTLDNVLARFATTGPEFGPGLSNHGPMASEALVALGRADAVEAWAESYASRLDDHPTSRNPIGANQWREPLGDVTRAGDWIAFFDRELRERPWREALDLWTGRLAPGIMSGATHGFIRTAHAVRTLVAGETSERLHELAEGLGYWAARYQELPGTLASPGTMPVAQALAAVQRLDEGAQRPFLIFDAVKAVATIDFEHVINDVATDGDPGAFVSDLTHPFARQYIANANRAAIAFVHTVTAPSALRIVAPHLTDETRRLAMACAWQACAAIYATFGRVDAADMPKFDEPQSIDVADLVDQAVATRDEHAIKFTEACLREYGHRPHPAFLAAAQDAVVRLRRA